MLTYTYCCLTSVLHFVEKWSISWLPTTDFDSLWNTNWSKDQGQQFFSQSSKTYMARTLKSYWRKWSACLENKTQRARLVRTLNSPAEESWRKGIKCVTLTRLIDLLSQSSTSLDLKGIPDWIAITLLASGFKVILDVQRSYTLWAPPRSDSWGTFMTRCHPWVKASRVKVTQTSKSPAMATSYIWNEETGVWASELAKPNWLFTASKYLIP